MPKLKLRPPFALFYNHRMQLTKASLVVAAALVCAPGAAEAQVITPGQAAPVELTLDRMVEIGLRDSYRVRHLQLAVCSAPSARA